MCRQVSQSSRENFEHFMRQNFSQNGRKVITGVSNPWRTCLRALKFSRNHFGTRHICDINKTELRTNWVINEALCDNIVSKLCHQRLDKRVPPI